MRKLLAAYLFVLALLFGGIFLLGNAQPALAQPVRAAAALPAAVVRPEAGPIDLSGLQPYWDQVQQLLQPAAAGLAPALLVWLTVNALVWTGLIKEDDSAGKKKRTWALGSGILFGEYASLTALAATSLPIAVLPLILALLGGIIRGYAAGIVAAFVYEAGSALLARGKATP